VSPAIDVFDERILVVAPTGKDGALAAESLRREGLCSFVCKDLVQLCDEFRRGAGALLVAEEALFPRELPAFTDCLSMQPPWSDVPVLLLTRGRELQENSRLVQSLAPVGNITVLERPLSALTLSTSVQTALRTRRRQYEVRDLIEQQKEAAEALHASQREVLQLNAELEQRVAQRTSELRAANGELEAFCYSVSHDLRAPLRAIDGFALSVMEHCNGALDETALSYLDRARKAVQRMQQLINDLLSLSRLSRAQMNIETVNLSALVTTIARELEQSDPGRTGVEFRIMPDVWVRGDAALLRIALENLLSNAWKFTGKKTGALIEFGVTMEQGEPTLFVRDDGAGFDMAFAAKLFVPFQRLHTSHEFPGSGIGLATVQRIIRRHNGEVWAQGKRGVGAYIYFRWPGALRASPNRTLKSVYGPIPASPD
jgi:signal transduction histidine kinase